MKTKAVVFSAANTVDLREVDLKPLGDDDVLIRTRLTSISAGTERMLLRGVMPHPMLQFPVVPGYETAGEVIDAGPAARGWIGKRVYVGGNYGFLGVNPAFGGQSAHIVAPQSHLTELGALTDAQGVMLALAATALHGVDQAGLRPADSQPARALVLGQGVVGQLAARIAKARGAHVTVTDRIESRLALSVADEKWLLGDAPPATNPQTPFDVLIDATGKMEAIAPFLMSVQKGGRAVLLGYYDAVHLPYMPVFLRELSLVASNEWAPGDLARARDLIAAGLLEVDSLITHRLSAEDAPRAFEIAFNDPACVKLVLTWEGLGVEG